MNLVPALVIVGLHGQLEPHAWISRELADRGELEEDVYSLVHSRSELLGLTAGASSSAGAVAWSQEEAGGNWEDHAQHSGQLAWVQVSADGKPGVALVSQVGGVLEDVVASLGILRFTGAHLVCPVPAAVADASVDVEGWLRQGDPSSGGQVVLAVRSDMTNGSADKFRADLIRRLQFLATPAPEDATRAPGPSLLTDLFEGSGWTAEGDILTLSLVVNTWTPSLAAWILDQARQSSSVAGFRGMCLVGASKTE